MKSTLQTFRDLPSYPIIVTRVVAIIHVLLGLLHLLPGLALFALLTKNESLVNLMNELSLTEPKFGDQDLQAGLLVIIGISGFVLVFLGLASLWVAFGNLTARPSIWVTTIWVTGLHVLAWLTNFSNITGVLTYLLLILALTAVVLYLFDNRIKAYFGRGPGALQYGEWITEKAHGRPVTATPWDYKVKEKPSMKPL